MGPADDQTVHFFFRWTVLLLALPTLPLIVGTFVLSQIPLHLAMVDSKRSEIQGIELMLEELMAERVSELTQDRREAITFLQRQRTEAEALPEWPFGSKAFASIGGSTLTAILPMVLKMLFPTLSLAHMTAATYWSIWLYLA
jgi:hypothetical protein